ncbi:MAG TPA: nucleotidyltransferase substrate binding protein [Bacteroidales bacterium]|nr:nucleotidyltransferase substrate binding protein [Bacteroidales bacterium]
MTSENMDIRWHQRFANFNKAYSQLKKFIEHEDLNELEMQGLVKAFEYTFELSWKTLQDLLEEKGYTGIAGPKPVIEQSFADGYISDGEGWMKMIISRNLTHHTYNEETAQEIVAGIKNSYFDLFTALKNRLEIEK